MVQYASGVSLSIDDTHAIYKSTGGCTLNKLLEAIEYDLYLLQYTYMVCFFLQSIFLKLGISGNS